MKRIGKCLNLELKYLSKSTLVFLGFYFCIYAVIVGLILYANQHGSSGSSVNSSFFIAGSIYIFAFIASSYRSLFNYLMMFGNTRKSIVVSSFIAYAALSVVISVISIISMLLDTSFTAVSRNSGFDLLDVIYKDNVNIATEFLWFLAFFILVSAFSMLFGSLAYKFGKAFIITFWVGLGFLLMFLPALYNPQYLVDALAAFFRAGSANGIYLAPINFILTAAVLGAAAYLAARRQPQNA
jgi:hypothetical protein